MDTERRTKHGVRDLNARGYNGNKSAACPHHRSPDFPTVRAEEPRVIAGVLEIVTVYRCTNCNQERWHEKDGGE